MYVKRLLMVTLIVSFFGSIQATFDLKTFKNLLKGALRDQAGYKAFEEYFNKNRVDVDTIMSRDGVTIGQLISHRLYYKQREGVLAVAKLIQNRRSNKSDVFRQLYKAQVIDPTALKDLKYWFDQFPLDVDTVVHDPVHPGKTFGECIAQRLRLHSARKGALAVAKLVQGARTEKESVLRTLYKAYEIDQSVFGDLKEWQEFVKVDVKVIRFDPACSETIAERIQALNRDDLLKLFNLPKTNNDGKKMQLSMGKKVGVVVLAAGAGLLYYYMNSKDKNKLSEQPQLPAAA